MARLNITYMGQNGDLPEEVMYDLSDSQIRRIAEEALRSGHVVGINAYLDADLGDFVVDRFAATGDLPDRLVARPKTAYGATARRRNQRGSRGRMSRWTKAEKKLYRGRKTKDGWACNGPVPAGKGPRETRRDDAGRPKKSRRA